jgi:hypothetical protein
VVQRYFLVSIHNFDLVIKFLQVSYKMSLQISAFRCSSTNATPNPGVWSSLCLINLYANTTALSQLAHGTIGSNEITMQRRLCLQTELRAAEEAEMLEAGNVDVEVVIHETLQTLETKNEMVVIYHYVSREREMVAPNIANPVTSSHATGAARAYHNPDADANDNVYAGKEDTDGDANHGPFD